MQQNSDGEENDVFCMEIRESNSEQGAASRYSREAAPGIGRSRCKGS